MKKCTILIFILLIKVSISLAQSDKVNVGIKGGANVNNSELYNYGYGFASMLFAQYNLTNTFSGSVGLGYEKKGTNELQGWADVNDDPLYELNIKQNYQFLSVPILIKASFGKKVRFFLNVGPCFNYLLKQTSKENDEYGFGEYNDNTHLYKNFEMGVSAGSGITFPLTEKTEFMTEIRHNWGINNLSNTDGLEERINTLSLLVGLKYRLY